MGLAEVARVGAEMDEILCGRGYCEGGVGERMVALNADPRFGLRTLARQRLGEDFDIREFHNVVLLNGSMPLDILEQVVQDWINERSAGA